MAKANATMERPSSKVKVVDYNLSLSDLSVGNVQKIINYYVNSNSHYGMNNSGLPLILNLHISMMQTSVSERPFKAGVDDVIPKYKGYDENQAITLMDVCLRLPIFPAPFEKDVIEPLYAGVACNYHNFEMLHNYFADYIKRNGIKNDNVLIDLDNLRDSTIDLAVFRTQQAQETCSVYYKSICDWCAQNNPEYVNDLRKFLQSNLDDLWENLLNSTKFMAYGSPEMVNGLSEMADRKDESAVDAQIYNLVSALMLYSKDKLAEYYHWLKEMSYIDDPLDMVSHSLMQSIKISDVYASKDHIALAEGIRRGFFADEQSPLDNLIYNPKMDPENMGEAQFYEKMYVHKKFAETLLRIIMTYGDGGGPQLKYCEELERLDDDFPKQPSQPNTIPNIQAAPKKHRIKGFINKLFNPNNPTDESDGNSPKPN